MNLDLQGSIELFKLPEILQLIASSKKSGTLGIQKDDSIVMVYFKDGDIIYGYGPRQTFHLGQLLKERGLLSDSQLDEAVRVQARNENSRRLGEILVSRKFIDRADLEAVVRKQIEELLYSLLGWQTGTFKFYENQFPTEEEVTVRLSVENVILEGLRRIDETNMVKKTIADFDDVYTLSETGGNRSREVNLEAGEWNVMTLVDSRRSVNDICRRSSLDRKDTLKKLAQLKLAGIIAEAEKKEEDLSTVKLENMVNRLANLFEDYLTARTADRADSRGLSKTLMENTVEPLQDS